MILKIKNNKYDVDIYDPDVMDAVENCATTLSACKKDTSSFAGMVRSVIDACITCIDTAVGAGVANECFGDHPKYDDCLLTFASLNAAIISAIKDVNEKEAKIYKNAVGEPVAQVVPAEKGVPTTPGGARKPVRVE